MSKLREPLTDEQVIAAGEALYEQYAYRVWSSIPESARILMAYARPRVAWAVDYELP